MGRQTAISIFFILIMNLFLAGQDGKSDVSTRQEKNLTEQVFITTDRDDYIAGEVLWFSSWLMDTRNLQPSSRSAIARIEILNSASIQVARSTIRLDNSRGYGQLKLSDTLSSGQYTIRAYTNLMRNYLPGGWFEKNINIFNSFKNKYVPLIADASMSGSHTVEAPGSPVDMHLISRDRFSTREQVNVEIQIPDLSGEPELSVSVVPLGSIHPKIIPDPAGGKVEQAGQIQYKPEYDCYFVSGKLTSKKGEPPAGAVVYFSIPGRIPVLKYARTDEHGRFSFKIGLDENFDEFIIQSDTGGIDYQLIVESSFFEDTLSFKPSAKGVKGPVPTHIEDMSVNAQIAVVYSMSSFGTELVTARNYREQMRFYGKPAKEVFVKDFIKLRNMEEIFFEIIPGVSLIKTGGSYEMQMKNSMGKILYDTPPMMMIDGVIIRDASVIARMDPEEIDRIDVVQDQYMVGDCIFNGIINVVTRTADFRNIPLPPGAIRMQNRIFDTIYEFAAPQFSGESGLTDHEPDYRNTLYWNPDLKHDPEGRLKFQFPTSDATGSYVICVQGFTSAGEYVSGYKVIQVTK